MPISPAGALDAQSNFAAVGDEDFFELVFEGSGVRIQGPGKVLRA